MKAPNSCKLFKTSFLSSSFNSGTLKITVPSSEIWTFLLSEKLPQVNSNSRKVQISNDGTVIVRVPELNEADKDKVLESLKNLGAYNLDKEDKVGASIGDDLKKSAIYSLGIGAILIVI